MASSLPHSSIATAVAAANAAAAAAISSSMSTAAPISSPAEHANSIRLLAVYDCLSFCLKDSSLSEASDVINLCYSLARGIDCAITLNNIPGIASRLPSLVKKVYELRKNAAHLSAIMMVLISIKSACKRGWFQPADSKELLRMVDEICNEFCTEVHPNSHVGHAFDTISMIMSKFCPYTKLCSLIASFEAKPGYDVLMSDFHFPKNHFPEQKTVLIVVKTQNLETSSCIAGPAQVSFIINGKGVDKRNNVSLDCGPQFPTDISKMLKYGINVLQAIGYFDGTYLIAVAYIGRMTTFTPALKEYVHTAVSAFDSDSELIEGPSRVSLCCPVSFQRIKTPVKGHLCKHHQCFDYDNYIEMNSRKPNWRCPHCNQSVCLADLRIDRNMIKVLEEVGDVTEVLVHSDGSWTVVGEHKQYTGQLHDGTRGQSENIECEAIGSTNSIADPVDLTMEDNDNGCTTQTIGQEVSLNGSTSQMHNNALEFEDRKPLIDVEADLVSQFLADPLLASYTSNAAQLAGYQTVNLMQPTFMSSYATNGPAAGAVPNVGALQTVPPNIMGNIVTTGAVASVFDATLRPVHTGSVMNTVTERITGRTIPRHVDRIPIAVQALPVHQTPVASERSQTNLHDVPLASNNVSPTIYQTVHTSMATRENFCGGISNMDVHQVTRALDAAVMQDLAPQTNPYVLNSTHNRPPLTQRMQQPPPFFQNPLQTPPGFRPPIIRPQPPPLSPAARLTSPHAAALMSGSFMNHLNQTQANHLAQLLRSQTAATASNLQQSRESSRVVGGERRRSLTGLMASPVARPENWRPSRRMRGSLTGSEYSAVLNHYMAPLSQPAVSRPPSPGDLMGQASGNQQHGFEHGEFGI